ncbi:MAG: hypothetical protein Q9220_001178 [cf. Caloplaca sp. 1 TL-2023]
MAFSSSEPSNVNKSLLVEERATESEAAGVPGQVQRITWKDILALAVSGTACAIGIAAVLERRTAVSLGQTNQLVVLGLMLGIMAFSTQRQVQKLTLLYEVRHGASTLQNLDAILQRHYFAPTMSWQPRLVIWFLLLLPLALGASYKTFSGGSTDRVVSALSMPVGATAAPGYQLIGNGLSLLVTVYLPFWINPSVGRTYGYNLFIADADTAAILDAPMPSYLTNLQSTLDIDQSILINASVHATVTQRINPSESERSSDDYWTDVRDSYGEDGTHEEVDFGHIGMSMLAGQEDQTTNYSQIYLSRWDTKVGQTFESQAERFITTRRMCTGTWKVTQANVSLVSVTDLQTAEQSDPADQDTIQDNSLSIGPMFYQFLGEFDWTSRKEWDQRLPDSSAANPTFVPTANTRSALVAAMMWSRLVSLDGPERYDKTPIKYPSLLHQRQPDEINMIKQSRTLQRSSWLIFILCIHPLLTVLAVLGKVLLFRTPISDDFGLISLLAGSHGNGVEKLRGAALSGGLMRKIRVRFSVGAGEDGNGYRPLQLDIDSQKRSDILRSKMSYG